MWLSLAGYRAEIARGAAAALERAREEPPAAALIDLNLVGPDGYEVARQLREALGAGVRLILLLPFAVELDWKRAMAAGLDGWAGKPVASAELFQLLPPPEDGP
jgi:DNA-binding response OmpR family regulator